MLADRGLNLFQKSLEQSSRMRRDKTVSVSPRTYVDPVFTVKT